MIAKTYLISQVTYLMGAIPADSGILDRANEIIIKFVNGKERKLAADRFFLTREQGGYGVTDMKVLNKLHGSENGAQQKRMMITRK